MIIGRAQIFALGAGNESRPPFARVVARARPLDLDHLGAEVGEQLPAPRPRKHTRPFDDSDAFERLRTRPRMTAECGVATSGVHTRRSSASPSHKKKNNNNTTLSIPLLNSLMSR